MVVLDAFPLPVTGTETQVNPGNEAYIYITEYLSKSREIGKEENAIGWYHSHPGYGCWLSGIDVSTQMSYQQFEEPWLAVVVSRFLPSMKGNRKFTSGESWFRLIPNELLLLAK